MNTASWGTITPLEERYPHRGEIVPQDAVFMVKDDGLRRARVVANRRDGIGLVGAIERNVGDHANRRYAGLAIGELQKAVGIAEAGLAVVVAVPRDVELAGDDVVGPEAGRVRHRVLRAESQ